MEISTRRFGTSKRPMLGLVQTPQPGRPRRAAFLLCRPFGQEAVRTAPIYRAMSDRLTREGCAVLTFDHHGCGDSPGELDEQAIADWALDTLAADQQLRAEAPAVPVHWFGMGLGANIAARAAVESASAPHSIVLWEPVLDGPAYLDSLLSMHRSELAREMQRSWHDLVRRSGESEPVVPGSVLGFDVGQRLHGELQSQQDLHLPTISLRGSRIVMVLQQPQRAALAGTAISGLTLQTVETPTNWMSIDAGGTAIVPQEIPRTLLATLKGELA